LELDRADALYDLPDRRKDSIAAYAAVADKHPDDPAVPQALYMAGFAALGVGAGTNRRWQYSEQSSSDFPITR